MVELFQVLQAGGDVGVWVLVFLFHRFDLRISILEQKAG